MMYCHLNFLGIGKLLMFELILPCNNKLMSDFAPLVRAVSQVHVRFDEQMQLPASPLHAYS